MNDEVGKRVVPASLFRFGCVFMGKPAIDFWQRNGASGLRDFLPGEDEESVRAFLVGIGFTEVRRWEPDDRLPLEQIAADMDL